MCSSVDFVVTALLPLLRWIGVYIQPEYRPVLFLSLGLQQAISPAKPPENSKISDDDEKEEMGI